MSGRTQRRSRKHPAFEDKCKEGAERNAAYAKLTPDQKAKKDAQWDARREATR